jgi:hypothetical protein
MSGASAAGGHGAVRYDTGPSGGLAALHPHAQDRITP